MAYFELWARSREEAAPSLRQSSPEAFVLETEGIRLARASGDEGVMSVWVQDCDGKVLWAAGEKSAGLGSTA